MSKKKKVVIITGSRKWDDEQAIEKAIRKLMKTQGTNFIVRHGACPDGADAIAEAVCQRLGIETDPMKADWKRYGRGAGPVRNRAMIEKGADLVLAFPLGESPGTRGCMALAEAAGIKVKNLGDLTVDA